MLPLKDDAPRITTPVVNYFLIIANVLAFLFELSIGRAYQQQFMFAFGLVPARVEYLLSGAVAPGGHVITPEMAFLPMLTSMFLHGGWGHLISNMWALYIFGDNVEDALGHFGYLLFYIGTGILAAIVHTLFNLHSAVPTVGASGAIAGVMGAYFVLYPGARVLTWVFIFLVWLPAWVMLGYWFVVQFLSGAATAISPVGREVGGIAFWAHVGGFLAGMLIVRVFPIRPRRYRYSPY